MKHEVKQTSEPRPELLPDGYMEEVYSASNPLVRHIHHQRLDLIVHSVPVMDSSRVLDAGCGEGHLLEKLHTRFPHHEYYGVDFSPLALPQAQMRCPYATLQPMDLTRMGFDNEYFDLITCTEVIEHVIRYREALVEMKRVLKTGGYLVLTFPNEILWTTARFLLGRRPIKVPDHFNSFTPRRIKKVVDMPLIRKRGMPFPLPFATSLGCMMKFQKI